MGTPVIQPGTTNVVSKEPNQVLTSLDFSNAEVSFSPTNLDLDGIRNAGRDYFSDINPDIFLRQTGNFAFSENTIVATSKLRTRDNPATIEQILENPNSLIKKGVPYIHNGKVEEMVTSRSPKATY